MNFKISHLQHVGIPVSDLSVSETFYSRLGFTKVMAAGFDHRGGKGKVAMMRSKEILIEIYQLPDFELEEIRNRKNGNACGWRKEDKIC